MAEPIVKECTRCGKVLPLESFHIHKLGKYGRDSRCKQCKLAIQAIHRSKPEIKERTKRYDALKYAANKESIKERARQPEAREINRKAVAKYKAKPGLKDKINKQTQLYRSQPDVSERIKESWKVYSQTPEYKERHRAYEHKKRSTIKGCIHNRMSVRMRNALSRGKQGRSWLSYVPYTLQELKDHLEKQFKEGMTWENRGRWHIDHKRPVKSFRFTSANEAEFKQCWALENLQPLWAEENIRKQAKMEICNG